VPSLPHRVGVLQYTRRGEAYFTSKIYSFTCTSSKPHDAFSFTIQNCLDSSTWPSIFLQNPSANLRNWTGYLAHARLLPPVVERGQITNI